MNQINQSESDVKKIKKEIHENKQNQDDELDSVKSNLNNDLNRDLTSFGENTFTLDEDEDDLASDHGDLEFKEHNTLKSDIEMDRDNNGDNTNLLDISNDKPMDMKLVIDFDNNEPKARVEITRSVIENGTIDERKRYIPLPSLDKDKLLWILENNESIFNDDNADAKDISQIILSAIKTTGTEGDCNSQLIANRENVLRQKITTPNSGSISSGNISPDISRFNKLTGTAAKAAVVSAVGLRSFFKVILPHSGLVAIIDSPSQLDLIDFYTKVDNSKIEVGRSIGGLNYGQSTWFFNDNLVELFIKCIRKINLKDNSKENIYNLLSPLDIPSIAYGLQCSMYPDGYPFVRMGITDEHTLERISGKIHLPNIAFYIDNKFSSSQKTYLTKASSGVKMENEEVLTYQNEFKDKYSREVTISSKKKITNNENDDVVVTDVKVTISQCSFEKYKIHGISWDNTITENLNLLISDENTEERKKDLVEKKIIATYGREVSHFISNIKIVHYLESKPDDVFDEKIISNEDDIISILTELTSDEEVMKKLTDSTISFINDSLTVVYGVPAISNFECNNSEPNGVSNSIVTINPVTSFFIMTVEI